MPVRNKSRCIVLRSVASRFSPYHLHMEASSPEDLDSEKMFHMICKHLHVDMSYCMKSLCVVDKANIITGDTFVCNRASLVFPPTLPGYSKTPYIFDRVGDRSPTIGFLDTYDRVCGQPGQVTRRYK